MVYGVIPGVEVVTVGEAAEVEVEVVGQTWETPITTTARGVLEEEEGQARTHGTMEATETRLGAVMAMIVVEGGAHGTHLEATEMIGQILAAEVGTIKIGVVVMVMDQIIETMEIE